MKKLKIINQKILKEVDQGFTLVEVLIAGVLMTIVLTAVARFSTQAMAGSHQQKNRQAIEAEINDNIQLVQQADSQITINRLEDRTDGFFDSTNLKNACGDGTAANNAAIFLRNEIVGGEIRVTPPKAIGLHSDIAINRNFEIAGIGNSYILRARYSFEGPEEGVDKEERVIEISPSFEAGCYQ